MTNKYKRFIIDKGFTVDEIRNYVGYPHVVYQKIIDNEYIFTRMEIIALGGPNDISEGGLGIRNNSTTKELIINMIEVIYTFKGKEIKNITKTPPDDYRNKPLPLTLKEKSDHPTDWLAYYPFITNMTSNDFEVGDKIDVHVRIDYEVDGVKYSVIKDFKIVCVLMYGYH
jgi:hypothetical protein